MFKLSINRICIPRNSIRKSHFSSSDGYDVNRVVLCHKKLLKSKPTPYIEGWSWQQAYLNLRIDFQRKKKEFSGDELNHKISTIDRDRILFFHHEHVYTLGRGADENNLTFLSKRNEDQQKLIIERLGRKSRGKGSSRLSFERRLIDDVGCHSTVEILMKQILNFSLDNTVPVIAPNNVPIYRIERGGEVTYHGPGQLVVYPLLNLREENSISSIYKQDLHWYLRSVEEVIIQTLSRYGISGYRDEINTGVWVNKKKIAAVGVSASKWITTHGFALNVNSDLDFFDTSVIIPCGIKGRDVTSIAEILKEKGLAPETVPSMEEVMETTKECFENVFGVKVVCDTDFTKKELPLHEH